jgi:ferritin-like metal-binding protein YciE
MAMQSPRDLLVYELQGIYDAEQRILQMLPVLAQETENAQTKQALQQHESETRQQVTNLEQCFQALGIQAKGVPCQAVAGLKQDHDNFLKEKPSPEVISLHNLVGAAKTECYEIASYKGLIEMATVLGEKQCVALLQQNLRQEEDMLKRVEQMAKQVSKQVAGQV